MPTISTRHGQQRGGDRPGDEGRRDAHCVASRWRSVSPRRGFGVRPSLLAAAARLAGASRLRAPSGGAGAAGLTDGSPATIRTCLLSASCAKPTVTTRVPASRRPCITARISSCVSTLDGLDARRILARRRTRTCRSDRAGRRASERSARPSASRPRRACSRTAPARAPAWLGNTRLQLDRARRGVDLVVERLQRPARDTSRPPGCRTSTDTGPRASAAVTTGRSRCGKVKITAIGIDLRDGHEPVGVGGVDDVAGIDLPQADATVDRRQRSSCSRGRPWRCRPRHGRPRTWASSCATIAACWSACCCEPALVWASAVALQIEARVGERRRVLRPLRHRLIVLRLVDHGIDARQHVALLAPCPSVKSTAAAGRRPAIAP